MRTGREEGAVGFLKICVCDGGQKRYETFFWVFWVLKCENSGKIFWNFRGMAVLKRTLEKFHFRRSALCEGFNFLGRASYPFVYLSAIFKLLLLLLAAHAKNFFDRDPSTRNTCK